ncbi:arginase family protein [Sutcliffiella cohnii]
MKIRTSRQSSINGNTITHNAYGHTLEISEDLVTILHFLKNEQDLDLVLQEFPAENMREIINELIEQGYLIVNTESAYNTINPIYCLGTDTTFFGCEQGNLSYDLYEGEVNVNRYGLIGIPYNMGSSVHTLPITSIEQLRNYSLEVLKIETNDQGLTTGWYIPKEDKVVFRNQLLKDYGDLEGTNNALLQLKRIEQISSQITQSDIIPLFIGGDHSITFPIVKGLLHNYEKLQIIQFDAHSDLGNSRWDVIEHGSFMKELNNEEQIKSILQIGVRGTKVLEEYYSIVQSNKIFSSHSLEEETLQTFPKDIPTYLTIDVDVLDPSIVPSVSYPVPNGWGYNEFLKNLEIVLSNFNIVGIDVVEYNPLYDKGNVGTSTIVHILLEILSKLGEPKQ